MTDEQKSWLETNTAFKPWGRHGVVSLKGWTDVGYLYPDGRYVADGQHHGWAWPTRLMSSGDTLHVIPDGSVKVAREYDIV